MKDEFIYFGTWLEAGHHWRPRTVTRKYSGSMFEYFNPEMAVCETKGFGGCARFYPRLTTLIVELPHHVAFTVSGAPLEWEHRDGSVTCLLIPKNRIKNYTLSINELLPIVLDSDFALAFEKLSEEGEFYTP